MNNTLLISYLFSSILIIWMCYRIYQLCISNKKLIEAIDKNYSPYKLKVESVSALTITERIKYGVPMPLLGIYNYFFGVLTGEMAYTRRVDLEGSGVEVIKFVTISVSKRKVISIKEFDSYNF